MELRRRLQNLASQQIVEELEYRNQLQQLNVHNQQPQYNDFNNFMAQNLQQQQPSGPDMMSLQDEYLLQRHQQLLMQEQMHQRLMAQGIAQAQESIRGENPAAAMSHLNQGNSFEAAAAAAHFEPEALRAAVLSNDEALIQQAMSCSSQGKESGSTLIAAAEASPSDSRASSASVNPSNEKSNATQRDQVVDPMTKKQLKEETKLSLKSVPAYSSEERENLLALAKSLASQKKSTKVTASVSILPPGEENSAQALPETLPEPDTKPILPKLKVRKRKNSDPGNEKKKDKKPIQEITKAGKLDGRTKKARELKKQALSKQRMLTDQEKMVVDLLSGKITDGSDENEKADKGKKKSYYKKKKKESESDEDFAAKIVLTFKATENIPVHEVKMVNMWSKRGFRSQYNPLPTISELDYPDLTPNLKFNLPMLPTEPEVDDTGDSGTSKTKVESLIIAMNTSGIVTTEVSDSILKKLSRNNDHEVSDSCEETAVKKAKTTVTPEWWPTEHEIRRERQLLGIDDSIIAGTGNETSFTKKSLDDAKNRLENSVEPGVLELLPHCKLGNHNGGTNDQFCFQVADLFPDHPMVCCSKCSTWRHVKCGGHYKQWSGRTDSANSTFEPVCDRCFSEEEVLKHADENVAKRIEMQRAEHLRRCNATNAVIQQYAFSRHFQSKWPLGSVIPGYFASHAKGVQGRHEKAEKQWDEICARLDCKKQIPRDRVRTRSRVLERILHSVEDAGEHYVVTLILRSCQVTNPVDPHDLFL